MYNFHHQNNHHTQPIYTGDEEWDLIQIRRHYFELWFWIDLVATFPMELLLVAAGTGGKEKRNFWNELWKRTFFGNSSFGILFFF